MNIIEDMVMFLLLNETCSIKRVIEVEGLLGNPINRFEDVYTDIKCMFDPYSPRSSEQKTDYINTEVDRITFFTYYHLGVNNSMFVNYKSKFYKVEYVNEMARGPIGRHLQIVCILAKNIA